MSVTVVPPTGPPALGVVEKGALTVQVKVVDPCPKPVPSVTGIVTS